MTFAQRMIEAQERLHPNQTINALRAEIDLLRKAIVLIEYASRKASLTDAERIQSIRHILENGPAVANGNRGSAT